MKIIVANWKMNHGFDDIDDWIEGFYKAYGDNLQNNKSVETILCPPTVLLDYIDSQMIEDGFHFLEYIAHKQNREFDDFNADEVIKYVYESRPLTLGAQDCGCEDSGQYTGDISAKLLKEVNCKYVIIGHSERRRIYSESNDMVMKKAMNAIKNEITPIICVGEPREIRDEGRHFDFIRQQIAKSVPLVKYKKIILAYEPIWAIGTGLTADIAQITEMTNFIRQVFTNEVANFFTEFHVIYGGSVNSSNSKDILSIKGVDGLLVGKASLQVDEFSKILLS